MGLKICYLKIDVSCEAARPPSIFIIRHKMQRLPRNLHVATTWRNDDGALQSAAPATKMQLIFWKWYKSIAPVKQNDFWHILKHV